MRLPNFLIIGAQKSGTTWFGRMLNQHPEVFVYGEEIHFFDKEQNFEKGIESYKQYFTETHNKKFVGEKTPDYLWANGNGLEGHLPFVHKNIYSHLPEAKLILLLRNPVERAISAVHHIVRTGRISPLFSIDRLLMGDEKVSLERYGIFEKGMYYEQIRAFQEYFVPQQMLILIYEEDVVENPQRSLERSCRFLGANATYKFSGLKTRINDHNHSWLRMTLDFYFPSLKRISRRLDKLNISNKVRPKQHTLKYLYDLYKEPNEKLFRFLGREIPSWKVPKVLNNGKQSFDSGLSDTTKQKSKTCFNHCS